MILNASPINSAPLNAAAGAPFVDWAANLDPLTTQTYYALDIDDGVIDAVRIPISSWQATVQLDRASFVQAVIPAALEWLQEIQARTNPDIIISRGVRFEDGTTQESELARVPLGTTGYQRGPTRATIVVTGYGSTPAPDYGSRTLQDVRSIDTGSGFRVRCAVDWFLRPGQLATASGSVFSVSYINYYANENDAFMDVGERVL